jgi:hypothetical protein
MYVDQRINDGSAMRRWHRDVSVGDWEIRRRSVRRQVEIQRLRKLNTNLIERLIRPITEPIKNTTIEQRG